MKSSLKIKFFGLSWLIAVTCLPIFVIANEYSPYPEPGAGYVTDHADLLTEEEEERLENWLWQVESKTQVEIIVVTIDSISDYPGTKNQSIDSFSTALFNQYGIGNLPANDGVLFVIARNDRKSRIELGASYGYGRDTESQRIMDNIILPEFRNGNYAVGITNGTEAIIKEFSNLELGFPWHIIWVAGSGLVFLIVGISLLRHGRKGWGYVFIGLAIVLFLAAIFIAVRFMQHLPESDSGGWSSGGMGGFGGGSSGGGGASGSW